MLWSYFGSTLDSDDYMGPVTTIHDQQWYDGVRQSCSHPDPNKVVEAHCCWCDRCGSLIAKPTT